MPTEILVTDEFARWYGSLNRAEQAAMERVVGLLENRGVTLDFPYSSAIEGSKLALRELRVQYAGEPYRILYVFDPIRQAVLLVGGNKTAKGNRWYTAAIRLAEKLYAEYMENFRNE